MSSGRHDQAPARRIEEVRIRVLGTIEAVLAMLCNHVDVVVRHGVVLGEVVQGLEPFKTEARRVASMEVGIPTGGTGIAFDPVVSVGDTFTGPSDAEPGQQPWRGRPTDAPFPRDRIAAEDSRERAQEEATAEVEV